MDDKEAIYNRLHTIYRNKGDKENQKRILKLLLVIHEKNLKAVEKANQVKGEPGKHHMFNVDLIKCNVGEIYVIRVKNT